jgi:pyruvate formate lyase activating enzyme
MNYSQVQGRIFDIQRFSLHDGNGIRTIVFLKGCFLRCKWCSNPESQEFKIQTANIEGKQKTYGKDVTVQEVLEEVLKDRVYYRRSNGGITLSGGECLFQPEFTYALLRESKENGLTTAIESTASTKYETIEMILPFLDTYLLDIKHIDSVKHKEFIGSSNEQILENAKKITDSGMTEVIIRVPVIPNFNSTEKEIEDIARFADNLKGVKKIHLLPYHRLGQDKYTAIGRDYFMKGILPPDNQLMEKLKKAVERVSKLECQIGG